MISPSVETDRSAAAWKEKTASWLVGQGFYEILTNSITNSAYYTEGELGTSVKMINNLSAELNILRPSLLETGLESLAYNLNRKNSNLQFFEFGKSYSTEGVGNYTEANHLCLYITGQVQEDSWKGKGGHADFFYLKTVCEKVFRLPGMAMPNWEPFVQAKLSAGLYAKRQGLTLVEAGLVNPYVLRQFDIKQPVWFADLRWDLLLDLAAELRIEFRELPKTVTGSSGVSGCVVVDRGLPFERVEKTILGLGMEKIAGNRSLRYL